MTFKAELHQRLKAHFQIDETPHLSDLFAEMGGNERAELAFLIGMQTAALLALYGTTNAVESFVHRVREEAEKIPR